jgi:hypothetical protein
MPGTEDSQHIPGQSPDVSRQRVMMTRIPGTRYELSDISVRPIFFTGAGIIIVTVVAGAICVGLMYLGISYRAASTLPATPVARDYHPAPPQPRLQASPRAEFAEYKTEQLRKLGSYQWVDQAKGSVRIPIDLAIRLTAERGIAPRKTPANLNLVPPHAGTRLTGFENRAGLVPQ